MRYGTNLERYYNEVFYKNLERKYNQSGGEKHYAEPSVKDVHVDRPLTNLSVAYRNDNYVANYVMPTFQVLKESDVYFVYTRADVFRDEMKVRGVGREAENAGYTLAQSNYSCKEWGLGHEIPDRVRTNADDPLSPDRDGVEFLTEKALLGLERRVANIVTSGTNMGSYVSLTGTNKWSDFANSNPISDVRTASQFMYNLTGKRPNTLIMGDQVANVIVDHPDILDRIKYTERGDFDASMNALKGIFRIQNVLVGDAIYNPIDEGGTASYSPIWGNNVVLAYVNPSPGLKAVTFGLTFGTKFRAIRSGRNDRRKVDWLEIEENTDERIIDKNCGYLIASVV